MGSRLDPWTAAGLEQLRRGRFHEAAATLERALGRAGSAVEPALAARAAEAWCCQGLAWTFAGDLGKARTAFERALALRPALPAARRALARILHRQGEPREALTALGEGVAGERACEVHLLRAVSLDAVGEEARARRALDDGLAVALDDPLDRASERIPSPPHPPAERPAGDVSPPHADAHCRAAARVFAADPRAAAKRLEEALRLNADFLRARVLLALADLRVGRPARAIDLLERARELEPSYPDVLAWLGLARLRAGDRDGASRALERAVTIERGFGRGHRFLSLIRHAEGRSREALVEARRGLAQVHDLPALPARLPVPGLEAEGADEEELIRSLAIRPSCADLSLALGRRRLETGRAAEAREALERTLALAPRLPAALLELGRVELALGAPPRAAVHLAQVVRDRPGWIDAQALLGKARLRSGDAAGAVAPLRAALRRRPALAEARSDLAWALLLLRRRDRRARNRAAWWEGTKTAG